MSDIGNREIFSKNLLFYLEKSGRSQKEVAEYVGVTPAAFNEWIKGKKYPRIDKIELLAHYFRILKSDLIEGSDKTKKSPSVQITEGEQELLDLFRRVPEAQQQMVLQMIRVALNTRE